MPAAVPPVRGLGFDCTGVVATLPEGNIFEQVARLAATDRDTVADYYHRYNRDFQVGRISQEQLWRRVAADLHIESRLQELWDSARGRLPRIDQAVLRIVDQLRAAGYRTGLLSNLASHTPWHDQLYREGVAGHIDAVCLSGETGLAKPDPAAFVVLARQMSVTPTELVYIDDRPQAFSGVEKLGVRTVLFNDLPKLVNDLPDLGVQHAPFSN